MSDMNSPQVPAPPQDRTDSPPNANVPRDKPFLIARQDALLTFAGVEPLDLDALLDQLVADPAVTVERVIAPEGLALLSDTPTALHRVVVARMAEEKAQELNQHPQVLIEEDAPVDRYRRPPQWWSTWMTRGFSCPSVVAPPGRSG